ncbi:MAG: hypothetical protein Q7S54_00750 [bacterium]|nr:hypothetical protein [bacterium]
MLRLLPIFLISFLLSIHSGALLYINSTFLGRFFGTGMVSLLFLAAAVFNIGLFLIAPRLLKYFGKSLLLLFFLFITGGATLGLANAATPSNAAFLFLIYGSFLFMNYYFLDIFLEELTNNAHTGEIRGLYFTFINAGIALGPLVVALFSRGDSLVLVYLAASLLLVPPIFIALFSFKPKRSETAPVKSLNLPFKEWLKNDGVRRTTLARVVLETFFGIMVIYTPIYLHGVLGFGWAELGIIFTVALLPFVFLEWPAGELADRLWGEKEIMSIGFFITGMSLLIMPFLGKSFAAWMLILLLSRVGASLIEITTESYFFKQIDASQAGLLGIFRLARPASYIFAVVVATLSLQFFSMEKLFFILAVIVFLGLRESLYLKDTR